MMLVLDNGPVVPCSLDRYILECGFQEMYRPQYNWWNQWRSQKFSKKEVSSQWRMQELVLGVSGSQGAGPQRRCRGQSPRWVSQGRSPPAAEDVGQCIQCWQKRFMNTNGKTCHLEQSSNRR